MNKSLYTVGHSNRGKDELLQILFSHGIDLLVDVRRFPGSKKFPQFNEGNLNTYLPETGIAYRHLGDRLGGYVERSVDRETLEQVRGWEAEGFRKYALYTEMETFRDGLDALIEEARENDTAIMCAEAWYRKCHRQLIADQLVARGWTVMHLQGPRRAEAHELSEAADVHEGRAVYRPT